ncbi:potassium channel subfamily K member 2-like isoform X2 [Ruditapes philippinarum]|uniref:potassium channel subfamily K member 2-like isoform X2 n=1 Tax=Ruditapes philippinarum TaxID=129788 RepID=UPI00295A79DF|nr:potassium channel subfamily K member 2-like isoform X2 [Ruditapes philippinarum]
MICKHSVLLRKLTTMEDGKATSVSLETLEAHDGESSKNESTENLDNSCLGKAKRILKAVYKGARSLVGLAIILIAYALIGALVFMLIESRHEQKYKSNITGIRDTMIQELLIKSAPITDKDAWKNHTKALLLNYESSIRDAIKNDVPSDSTEEVWTMWSSLFFVFTVFTTIGYGNLAPVTGLGRVLCIVYAGIGVPLALLLLAELGKRFTMALKFLWAFVRRYYYYGYCKKVRERNPFQRKYELNDDHLPDDEAKSEDGKSDDRSRSGSRIIYGYEVDDEFNVPITIAILILFVYILLGAMMYSIWEDWDFIEAIYFVFISLSTIGFGDILPAHQKFFVVSSIYMFIGLSLVSMCINVAIEFFNVAAVRAKRKVGEAKKKIGDKAKQAHRNAKEKVADIKTNIADETSKFKHKSEEKVKKLRTNIADETSKFKQKTDEKISGIKTNISEETTKFRKKADDKFRRKPKERTESSPAIIPIHTDNTYDEIGTVKSDTVEEKL